MNKTGARDALHGLQKYLLAALLVVTVAGCKSGVSGHAPGLATSQPLNPGVLNYPLAYIRRPPPKNDIDARDLITSTDGGDVYVRDQASASALETNVTGSLTGGKGDVRDLDVSPDGKKLIFSLRMPLDPNLGNTDVRQPTWKIYEYDPGTKALTQLTNDGTTAGHDISPHYLPDGRIVFSSTRQAATRALLIDEGRPQYPAQTDNRQSPIFLLHVMNADGTNIRQISFNTNHDFAPSVLANGQIVFSRYDNPAGDEISLYRVNPDGTRLELLYGANSHATGVNVAGTNDNVIQFLNARERDDGKIVAIARPFTGTQLGGDIVAIDSANFVELNQPAQAGGPAGTAQVSATTLGVTTDAGVPSLGGRFASVYPLHDGTTRMLVSWAPCLLLDTSVTPSTTHVCTSSNINAANMTLAPAQYTIWVYDTAAGTLSPILASVPGSTVVEPVIMQARSPAPSFIPDPVLTGAAADLAHNSNGPMGILEIRSVYDVDGVDTVPVATANTVANIAAIADPKIATANQRPARFIRIEKAVEIPDRTVRRINNSAFGPAGMGMREILGYAPVEPDGSVKIQVPANVPLTFDIVDKNARRIGARHTSWLQVMPGETKVCNGCHTAGSTTTPSHGRAGLTTSVNAGATSAGVPFPHTVAGLSSANAGDTMADTRAWSTCQTGSTNCSQAITTDVLFTDVWTDPVAAGRPADTAFAYAYADLNTPQPENTHCLPWDPLCRSTIHYPLHIQPVWSYPRKVLNADGSVQSDHTCTVCHAPIDAANAAQVPAGSLDLSATVFNNDPTVTVSYRQLLFPHNQQTLNMGAVGDRLVPVPGPPDPVTGAPTTLLVPVQLAPPMIAGSASASVTKFLKLFDGTFHDPVTDHTGFLTTAELRLITEWLDIGAQYYNDPFVAPAAN